MYVGDVITPKVWFKLCVRLGSYYCCVSVGVGVMYV